MIAGRAYIDVYFSYKNKVMAEREGFPSLQPVTPRIPVFLYFLHIYYKVGV